MGQIETEQNGEFYGDKSLQCFVWTCQRLAKYASTNGQKLYFWTFTFRRKMPDFLYSYYWRGFNRSLLHLYRYETPFYGVKVVERHKKGGLHYHCVVNHRVPIKFLLRIGKKYGIGRMSVTACYDFNGIADYLSKYLGKGLNGGKLGGGLRRWHTMGGFPGAKVVSLVRSSPAVNAVRLYKRVVAKGRPVSFPRISAICGSQNILDPLHLSACLAYAKANDGDTLAFEWSWRRLELEVGFGSGSDLDGICPF